MTANLPADRRTSVLGATPDTADGAADQLRKSVLARPQSSGRASKIVMLGLLGVGALGVGFYGPSLFSDSEEEAAVASAQADAPPDAQAATQRNGYATREECEANYSREQCTPGQTQRSGLGFIPIFWGPFYNNAAAQFRPAGDPGPGRVSRGMMSEPHPKATSARAGFGSSAAGHGSTAAGAHSGVGHS